MAGTINLALTQQFDTQGDPLSGGLLEFFQAGTTNPQNSFQDVALSIVHPNPIVLDASGRVPMFYLADGFIKIRLKDKNGVVIIAADQLLVIGPSSGGSGGAGVDVTTVLQTGDIKARYGFDPLTGFVRCNGNTIGQTGSSATEIGGIGLVAQALYEYLWAFPNIALDSAVRGVSATSDFGALKRLILPDLRGRTIAGLDDMGAAGGAANRLTTTFFGATASGATNTAVGRVGGDEKHSLVLANLPTYTPQATLVRANYTPSGTNAASSVSGSASSQSITIDHFGMAAPAAGAVAVLSSNSGTTPNIYPTGGGSISGTAAAQGFTGTNVNIDSTFTGTTLNPSGPTAHATVTPAMVMSIYIKL
jgi:hypothetical protein